MLQLGNGALTIAEQRVCGARFSSAFFSDCSIASLQTFANTVVSDRALALTRHRVRTDVGLVRPSGTSSVLLHSSLLQGVGA
jgi:hypothetical protein